MGVSPYGKERGQVSKYNLSGVTCSVIILIAQPKKQSIFSLEQNWGGGEDGRFYVIALVSFLTQSGYTHAFYSAPNLFQGYPEEFG